MFLLPHCAQQLPADQAAPSGKMSLLRSDVLVRVQPYLLLHPTVPIAQPAPPAITGDQLHAR